MCDYRQVITLEFFTLPAMGTLHLWTRRPRICEWRALSHSLPIACSPVILSDLTEGLRPVPGRLHACKVVQPQCQKDLDQPLLSLKITGFFSQSVRSPQDSLPPAHASSDRLWLCAEEREKHPQAGGGGPCLPCQHPPYLPERRQKHTREGQSDAKPQGGVRRASARILQHHDR